MRLKLLPTTPERASAQPTLSGGWTAWEVLGEAVINVLPLFLDG